MQAGLGQSRGEADRGGQGRSTSLRGTQAEVNPRGWSATETTSSSHQVRLNVSCCALHPYSYALGICTLVLRPCYALRSPLLVCQIDPMAPGPGFYPRSSKYHKDPMRRARGGRRCIVFARASLTICPLPPPVVRRVTACHYVHALAAFDFRGPY